MFNCRTIGEARKKRDQILADYKDIAESAMLCLDEGFESAMTVMALPAGLRRFCRTSNHIERLNRELKRRSSVIGIFPNEESLVRTMGAVLIEESHQRQSGRALFSPKTFKEFMTPEVIKTLIEIAHEQQRVMAAAQLWLSQHETQLQPRFDVIEVYAPQGENGPLRINHLPDAFR